MSKRDIVVANTYAMKHPAGTKRLAKAWARKHPTQAKHFKTAVLAFQKSFSSFVVKHVGRKAHHRKTR
jgi:hypothetical protein